jgi:hypothetical protein
MEQCIPFSISDLVQLLKDHSMKRGAIIIKVASQRLICNIDGCRWQGCNNVDLDSHVHASHDEASRNINNEKEQLVLSETESQELAVQGTAVIEGNGFRMVQPIRFLFFADGGRWYSEGTEHIYNTATDLTAKEAQLLRQLQDAKNKHAEEIARKDECVRAQQEINKFAQFRIEQLEQELSEAMASLDSPQTQCSAIDMPVQDKQSQEQVINAEKGMLDFNATTMSVQQRAITNKGNDAPHRAHFLAHFPSWERKLSK